MFHLSRMPTYRSEIYQVTGPVRWCGRPAGLYLSSLGRFHSTGHFAFQQVLPAENVAAHLVQSGRGVLAVDGRQFDIKPGDVFVFFPGRHYNYHDFPNAPWRYTWFTLEGPQACAALRQVGVSESEPLLSGVTSDAEPLFQDICDTYRHPTIASSFAIAAGWRAIDVVASARQPQPPPRSVAETARFLIDRHTMEVISIATLADQLDVSRSALFRLFREAYGVSPKQYLDRVRLDRARGLLRRSLAPIKQIASACGYASSQYFIRAFAKAYGQSPGAWRKDAQ